MKQCPKCRAVLNDDAVFCTACGTNTTSQTQSGAAEASQNQNYSTNQNFSSGFQNQQQPYVNPSYQQPYGQQNVPPSQFQPIAPADNRKTFCVMSYIGVLWLFGMLSAPEKFDARVRFNVGQGIIASILSGALTVIAIIITAIIRATTEVYSWSTLSYTTSAAGTAIITLIWLAVSGISVFYMVYGIMKVCQGRDAYLPVIGKLAFYK